MSADELRALRNKLLTKKKYITYSNLDGFNNVVNKFEVDEEYSKIEVDDINEVGKSIEDLFKAFIIKCSDEGVNCNEIVSNLYISAVLDFNGLHRDWNDELTKIVSKLPLFSVTDEEFDKLYNVILKNTLNDCIQVSYDIDWDYTSVNDFHIVDNFNEEIKYNPFRFVKYSDFVKYFKDSGYDLWEWGENHERFEAPDFNTLIGELCSALGPSLFLSCDFTNDHKKVLKRN